MRSVKLIDLSDYRSDYVIQVIFLFLLYNMRTQNSFYYKEDAEKWFSTLKANLFTATSCIYLDCTAGC